VVETSYLPFYAACCPSFDRGRFPKFERVLWRWKELIPCRSDHAVMSVSMAGVLWRVDTSPLKPVECGGTIRSFSFLFFAEAVVDSDSGRNVSLRTLRDVGSPLKGVRVNLPGFPLEISPYGPRSAAARPSHTPLELFDFCFTPAAAAGREWDRLKTL